MAPTHAGRDTGDVDRIELAPIPRLRNGRRVNDGKRVYRQMSTKRYTSVAVRESTWSRLTGGGSLGGVAWGVLARSGGVPGERRSGRRALSRSGRVRVPGAFPGGGWRVRAPVRADSGSSGGPWRHAVGLAARPFVPEVTSARSVRVVPLGLRPNHDHVNLASNKMRNPHERRNPWRLRSPSARVPRPSPRTALRATTRHWSQRDWLRARISARRCRGRAGDRWPSRPVMSSLAMSAFATASSVAWTTAS